MNHRKVCNNVYPIRLAYYDFVSTRWIINSSAFCVVSREKEEYGRPLRTESCNWIMFSKILLLGDQADQSGTRYHSFIKLFGALGYP